MLTVTFDELEAALAARDAPLDAAEVHGALCGALAGDARFDPDAWIDTVLPDDADGDADVEDAGALRSRNLLETLVAETQAALDGPDLEFEPLLPSDEAPLEQRVQALADWCAGYLGGIGTAQLAGALPAPVDEVVRDFGEISRASIDAGETEESNESSYAEIVEYLRAGAQLAYEELAGHRAGDPTP